MVDNTTTAYANWTAAQRALAVPEILAIIFNSIDGCYNPPGKTFRSRTSANGPIQTVHHQAFMTGDRAGPLSSCCRVSRLWHAEATPLLREEYVKYDGMEYGPDLLDVFKKIPDDPLWLRQRHAHFVDNAKLQVIEGNTGDQAHYDILAKLAFPRLKSMTMVLVDDGDYPGVPIKVSRGGWRIPRFGPNKVEELILDTRDNVYPAGIDRDELVTYGHDPDRRTISPTEWEDILGPLVVRVAREPLCQGLSFFFMLVTHSSTRIISRIFRRSRF